MIKLTILALTILLCACTNDNDAKRALMGMGFTDINTTGYQVFGCSEDDHFHTGFTAKNPNGQQVSGVVCSGFFKAGTVRF